MQKAVARKGKQESYKKHCVIQSHCAFMQIMSVYKIIYMQKNFKRRKGGKRKEHKRKEEKSKEKK